MKPCDTRLRDEAGHLRRELAPRLGRHAPRGHGAERIEAEADVDRAWRKPSRLHVVRDEHCRLPRGRTEIELDGNAPIEMNALEHRLDRRFRRRKGIAVIADGSLEHEHDASRGVVQIVEDLLVGGFGIGQIDALHHRPGLAGFAAGNDVPVVRARVKRLDGDTVITGRAERGERRALQRLLDQRLPVSLAAQGKVARQGNFSHCRPRFSPFSLLLARSQRPNKACEA